MVPEPPSPWTISIFLIIFDKIFGTKLSASRIKDYNILEGGRGEVNSSVTLMIPMSESKS